MKAIQLTEAEAEAVLGISTRLDEHGLLHVEFKGGQREVWLPVDGPTEAYAHCETWLFRGQLYINSDQEGQAIS